MVLRGRTRSGVAVRVILVAVVTLAAAVLLLRNVDAEAVLRMLASANIGWTAAGGAVFLFGHLLRYWRYSLVWAWPPSPAFLATTALHGFASYVLPLRLGELVLPLMLRRHGVAGFPQALGGLLMVRVYDALVVLVLGAALVMIKPDAVLFLIPDVAANDTFVIGIAALAVFLCVGALWLLTGRLGANTETRGRARFSFLSMLIWLSVLGMNLAVMRALELQVLPLVLVLLLVLGIVVTITPVQGLAGLGGHQLVWVLALTAGGMGTDHALEVALASHVLIVLYVCVLGLAGLGLSFVANGLPAQRE